MKGKRESFLGIKATKYFTSRNIFRTPVCRISRRFVPLARRPKKEMNAYCSRPTRIVLDPRNHSSFDEQSNKSTIDSHRAQTETVTRLAASPATSVVLSLPEEKVRDVFEVFLEIGGKCVSLPVARLSKEQRCCATRSILPSCSVYSRLYTGCQQTVRVTRGWVLFIFENIIKRTFPFIHRGRKRDNSWREDFFFFFRWRWFTKFERFFEWRVLRAMKNKSWNRNLFEKIVYNHFIFV